VYETIKNVVLVVILVGAASIGSGMLHTFSLAPSEASSWSEHAALTSMIVAALGVWVLGQWRVRLGPLRANAEEEWSAKSFVPSPAMARIYVFRESECAPLLGVELRVDDVPLGETYGKTFFQVDLLPGEHLLTGMDRTNGSRCDHMLCVKAGHLYFVKQVVWSVARKSRHGFITLCEPVQAQSAVRRCRMLRQI